MKKSKIFVVCLTIISLAMFGVYYSEAQEVSEYYYGYIIFVLILLLIGISLVSIHYREKYEELRRFIKILEMKTPEFYKKNKIY